MCMFSAPDWANLGWKWLCWDWLAWLPLLGLLELEWKEKLNLHYELGLRSHMLTGCHLPLLFDQLDKLFGFFCHFNEAKKAESKRTYTSKVATVNISAKWISEETGWAYLSWCLSHTNSLLFYWVIFNIKYMSFFKVKNFQEHQAWNERVSTKGCRTKTAVFEEFYITGNTLLQPLLCMALLTSLFTWCSTWLFCSTDNTWQ